MRIPKQEYTSKFKVKWHFLKKLFLNIPASIVVIFGFFLAIAFSLTVACLNRNTPSPEMECYMKCEKINRFGVMVYVHPPEITVGMRDRGKRRCECR